MGQSAAELREDIADTRTQLGETVDAIGDRVSPGRIVERRKNRMVGGLRSAKDRVMGTAGDVRGSAADSAQSAADMVQGNPLVVGAVAFGVGFLVAAAIPPSEVEEDAAERLLDKAEPVKQQLVESGKELAGSLKDSTTDAAESVKETATQAGKEVASTAKDASSTTKDAVAEAGSGATRDIASTS